MSNRASPTAIGAFVVSGVILAVVAVGVFGSGRFFRRLYPAVLYFQGDVNGLKVGAPVKFKGIQIGTVKSILLRLGDVPPVEGEGRPFNIPVVIELDGDKIVEKGGSARMDRQGVSDMVARGLRGQLKTESFVTGVLYVDLGLFPGAPAELFAGPAAPFPEIPTLPTALEEAQAKAASFLAKLDELDINGLVNGLKDTVNNLDRLVKSPGLQETLDRLPATLEGIDEAAGQLRATLAKVEGLSGDAGHALRAAGDTLQSADEVLAPDSPVLFRLTQALDDLSLAAASVRRLADDLERDPAMLVRGRREPTGGTK